MSHVGDGRRPSDPRVSIVNHRVVLMCRQALANIIPLSVMQGFLFNFIPIINACLVLFICLLFVALCKISLLLFQVYLSNFGNKIFRDSRN